MFDLKVINSVLTQLEEERGIPKEKTLEAIEAALATAYKKEYGKRGQVIKAKFDLNSGAVEMYQVKTIVDESSVIMDEMDYEDFRDEIAGKMERGETVTDEEKDKELYTPEKHILLADAKLIKKDAKITDEMVFPLEDKGDYGRIAAQTAKQAIMQKIREAERESVIREYGERDGEIVNGTVQRIERGNLYIDMGRATGLLPYEEQIPGERFNQGERVRAYLFRVEDSGKGVFLRLSRSHPKFLEKLFMTESPELANGTISIKAVAREAGSRSKVAVASVDNHIDPVGSMVGQRGVRVSTVMAELHGEKIDVIEWHEDPKKFIEEALSPAKVISIETNDQEKTAKVKVASDQQSLAIGKGGQNVRLAAKLTGWKIDIQSDVVEEPKPMVDAEEGYVKLEDAKVEVEK